MKKNGVNATRDRVVNQKIARKRAADFIADKIVELDRNKLKLDKARVMVSAFKQLNRTNKNELDAQRLVLKFKELELKEARLNQ